MQRFVWDLMYPNPPSDNYDLPISAIYKDTPFVPQGPAVLPGIYTVTLTVDGKSFSQKLKVRMDPRVTTPPTGLLQQFKLSMQADDGIRRATDLANEVKTASDLLTSQRANAGANAGLIKSIDTIEQKIKTLTGGGRQSPGLSIPVADFPLGRLAGSFTSLLDLLQDADVTPSQQALQGSLDLQTALTRAQKMWVEIKSKDLPALNATLQRANLAPISN